MSFFVQLTVRHLHLMGATILLGGSLLLWSGSYWQTDHPKLFYLARIYEIVFWLFVGIQVLTGFAVAALLRDQLPAVTDPWGRVFLMKMLVVFVLLLVSLYRTILLSGDFDPPSSLVARQYGFTTLLLGTIVALAVRLAYG